MSAWHGVRVLVTGGGGFIGSHLVERLSNLGAKPRVLLRYTSSKQRGWLEDSLVGGSVECVFGDVSDRDVVRRAVDGCEIVFHLAALIGIPYSYEAPQSYVQTNIEGTLNVLQASLDAGVRRVVHTSTSEVYGTALRVPMDEAHPLQTQSPYAASKAAADMLAWSFFRSYGLPVTTVRPFNTYGPRQSLRAVIPTIIAQAISGPEIKLGHVGPTRDFNYVLDTVDGFVRIAESEAAVGSVLNLGTGTEVSIVELARLIQEIAGTNWPVVLDHARARPADSEVDRLCADASRAGRVAGWRPTYSLAQGLAVTVEWFKSHTRVSRSHEYHV